MNIPFNPIFLWAKKNNLEHYHPLLYHMLDVAAALTALLDSPRIQPVMRQIVFGLHVSEKIAQSWIPFFGSLHDLGKAYPHFQNRKEGTPFVISEKLNQFHLFPCKNSEPEKHAFVTAAVVEEAFLFNDLFCSFRLAQVLGGHHGLFPDGGVLQKAKRKVNFSEKQIEGLVTWTQIRSQLVKQIREILFPYDDPKIELDGTDNWTPLLLTGLIAVADWIGSNEDFFPYREDHHFSEIYWNEAQEKARKALSEMGWLDWRPHVQSNDFSQLFPFIETPRPLQEELIRRQEELQNCGMVIIEAPMGEGKTEAALYLQDLWCSGRRQAGAYFALPTMAASNQLFNRTKDFLQRRYPKDRVNFLLLHSHAMLNDEYQKIRIASVADDEKEGGLEANDWFTKPKRGFLAPFAVGTVDQALLAVLQVKYGFVRLFGLAGKTLIFDEVHAYDAYMLTLFTRLLEWLSRLNTKVVILSATLPEQTRRKLFEAYSGQADLSEKAVYPRISYVGDDGLVRQAPISVSHQSRAVRLQWIRDDRADIARQLADRLAEGGCAVWICNTVSRAQDTYSELKELLAGSGIELELFHARYPLQQRFEKEKRVTALYGKDRSQRPAQSILIATQVIEQSLDLDFDWMISDLAPIDLLLQRSGRLHRHAYPRPDRLSEPTLQIIQPDGREEDNPVFKDPVYDEYILLRTWQSLRETKKILIPDDIEELIENVYSDNPLSVSATLKARLNNAWDKLKQQKDYEINMGKLISLSSPDVENILNEWSADLDEENPDVHDQIKAKTRLTPPSVTVIPYWNEEEIDLPINPQEQKDRIRSLIYKSVNLSYRGCMQDFPDDMIPKAWRKNPWLRYNRAVCIDPTQNQNLKIVFDNELGVVIHSLQKEGESRVSIVQSDQ